MIRGPMEIVDDWLADPDRPIFLVDETRRSLLPAANDELIVYNCVVVHAKDARAFLRRTVTLREQIGNESFKGRNFDRPEMPQGVETLKQLVLRLFIRRLALYRAAALASALKSAARSVRARITTISESPQGLPPMIEGRELLALITLIKTTANSLEVGPRQVDVIVDQSDQFGLHRKKRRLPEKRFEVLGPGQFNTGPNGRPAEMQCAATFRIVADSDQGVFRDLLLLPDYVGYRMLRNSLDEAFVARLRRETMLCWLDRLERAEQTTRES